jgi:hypothetical protein
MPKLNKTLIAILCTLGISSTVLGCAVECYDGVCETVYGTGYYYDSLVTGVAYSTQAEDGTVITGVTGERNDPGRFSFYTPEAMVTFSLGDTELGSSVGKDRVTPFDLAGVAEEAVGGCQVDGELPEDDFRIVHNLAVLLQTFDTDGDPSEGIEISAETAALFEGINIDVDQAWEDFQADTTLGAVLAAANDTNQFPETRTLREREEALAALYEGIGLCPAQ